MTTSSRLPVKIAAWIDTHARTAALIYILALALLGVGAWLATESHPLNTDLFSLVDQDVEGLFKQNAIDRVRSVSEQRQTWIIRHESREQARRATLRLKEALTSTGLVSLESATPAPAEILAFYQQYRFRLADDEMLALASDEQALVERVVRQLYRNTGGTSITDLANDPFLLQASFLSALARTPAPFSIDSGLLHARLAEEWHYLLPVQLNGSTFDFGFQDSLFEQTGSLRQQIERDTGAKIGSLGAIDFAHANRQLATSEVTLIGGLSLVAIACLLFGSFRAIRPALALLITLVCAICGGVLTSLITFGSIHLLTLITGTSLLGISVDYAFHLMAQAHDESSEGWSAGLALQAIAGPLSLGLATSLLGMTGLYASGFGGLQQIAVFSGAGLISAYLSVWLCFPALLSRWQPAGGKPALMQAARGWVRHYQPPRRALPVIAALGVSTALIVAPATPNSDIRLLSASAPEIDALLERSKLLSRFLVDTRFLIVAAEDADAMLEAEESLRPKLEKLIQEGSLASYQQLSRFAPSMARQEAVFAANQRLILDPGQAVELLRSELGLKREVVDALRQGIPPERAGTRLTLSKWLQSPLAPLARDLYLGEQSDRHASITTLAGLKDPQRLQSVLSDQESVQLIDNVSDISALFDQFTRRAILGLGIAFILVSTMMVIRYGPVDGIHTMLVPLSVCASTLTILLLTGVTLNLFHVVGLTLVLGIGMDYVLFLKAGRFAPHTMLAVLLAACTTLFAFGLLGLSCIGAIESFGTTVALGTALNLLLAPMVRDLASVDR